MRISRRKRPFVNLVVCVALAGALPAFGQTVDDIVGNWRVSTQMGDNTNESTMTLTKGDDGLKGTIGGRRGSLDLDNVSFENGKLSYDLKLPQLNGQSIHTEVTFKGDTFEGVTKSPIGDLPVKGKRITEAELAAQKKASDKLIGDWTMYSKYNNDMFSSKLRFFRQDNGRLAGMLIMRGSRIVIERMRYEGGNLRFSIAMPLIADQAAHVNVKVDGNKFDGVAKTVLGDIPVTGELVDTTKLVLAPYDDPKPVLGTWNATTTIEGEEYATTATFTLNDQKRLEAVIEGDAGTWESKQVDFKKVSDTMSVVRVTVDIPEMNTDKPQVFELIINGDTFSGEELNSNGEIELSGTRKKG